MNDFIDIDEMLNSFIDDQLSQRQHTEIQRLIDHDQQIAKRFNELQKLKTLVTALPHPEAPAEMLENIKAELERRTSPEQLPTAERYHRGARHLLIRKALSAAAMIGLTAVLGVVIYSIVAPETVPERTVVKKPIPILLANTAVKTDRAATVFNVILELKTDNFAAAGKFVKTAINNNGLLEQPWGPINQNRENVYSITCSKKNLEPLLADLYRAQAVFTSQNLLLAAADGSEQIVVNAIKLQQIAKIITENNAERRIKAAKYFAVLNNVNMNSFLSVEQPMLAINLQKIEPTAITIPKPQLTSGQKVVEKTAGKDEDQQMVHLTIILVNGQ